MSCNPCSGLPRNILLNTATSECLSSMKTDHQDNLFLHLEFWQTWSNMEFAAFVVQSPKVSNELKKEAEGRALSTWKWFSKSDKGTPCFYLDKSWVANKQFWDPTNINILWDDRLWLGLSYLQLYTQFKVQDYLDVALKLFQFVLDNNDDPFKKDYIGLRWKSKEDYRNTITNGLFMVFAGRLYGVTSEKKYLEIAKKQYQVLFQSEGKYMLSAKEQKGVQKHHLLPDYSESSPFWTYNQALPLQGLAQLIIYDTTTDSHVYLKWLIKLVNSIVAVFRQPGRQKFICCEIQGMNEKDKSNCSIFRSYLFRHLITMRRLLALKKGLWEQLLESCPTLQLFLKDNFQAMCKFQTCKPVFDWQDCAGTLNYYNSFNAFYVLYCGYELLGLEEMAVDGIELNCNNVLVLSVGKEVDGVWVGKVKGNKDGKYTPEATTRLKAGENDLKAILDQDFCSDTNNRNVLSLKVLYKGGREVYHCFAHLQTAYSQFAIIPDKQAHNIANANGIRIISDIIVTEKTYNTYSGSAHQLVLKRQQSDPTKPGPLGLYIT